MIAKPIGPQVPIRNLREAHRLSVKDLVERMRLFGCEIHPDSIRNIELGHKRASRTVVAAWAQALGLHQLDVYQPPDTSEEDAA